jgi:hypothetical protein
LVPVLDGHDRRNRMLSLALASWSNAGLIVAPFLRRPGHALRFLLVASLASGAIVSLAWLAGSLSDWTSTAVQYPERFVRIALALAPSTITFYTMYGVHTYLCIRFIFRILSASRDDNLI